MSAYASEIDCPARVIEVHEARSSTGTRGAAVRLDGPASRVAAASPIARDLSRALVNHRWFDLAVATSSCAAAIATCDGADVLWLESCRHVVLCSGDRDPGDASRAALTARFRSIEKVVEPLSPTSDPFTVVDAWLVWGAVFGIDRDVLSAILTEDPVHRLLERALGE